MPFGVGEEMSRSAKEEEIANYLTDNASQEELEQAFYTDMHKSLQYLSEEQVEEKWIELFGE